MPYEFNAKDIFDMAEQIERNGADFYRKAAQTAVAGQHKDFLLELAEMEDDHEKIFSDMKQQLNRSEATSTVFDPDDQNTLYLKALADTRVFFEKPVPESDMKDILSSAIQTEKDSIAFYLGMKEVVPDSLGKTRLDDIIKEEMGHIRLLADKLTQFK